MKIYGAGAQALARQNLTVVGQSYELGRVTVFEVLAGVEAGMDGYLSKPIDVDELIATLERFGGDAHARRGVPAAPFTGRAMFSGDPMKMGRPVMGPSATSCHVWASSRPSG